MSDSVHRGALDLGEVLLETSRLEPEQLAEARLRQESGQGRLGEVLIEAGMLSTEEVLTGIASQLGLEFRKAIAVGDVDEELLQRVPISFAKQHGVLPLNHDAERGILRVVTSDPFQIEPIDDLRILFSAEDVEVLLSGERSILSAINEVYDRGAAETGQLAEEATDDLDALADEASHEPQDLLEATDDAPIIRLVNSLLQHAVKERASDIHIEPFEKQIRVRFRIDDVLYEPMKPLPRTLQASIASRIKIMGNLDIAEKRLPQDGRIRLKIAGRDYDVRLSTVPVAFGERLVLRLLPDSQALLDLEKIGFNAEQSRVLERVIRRPNGIFLVTGPTGSGKTTTLHACLSEINDIDKNIITIEEPVEITQKGIGQIEVNPKINLSFATGLRAVLRQDPNVVLVGEIRDKETADIAIQATNDAFEDTALLGVEPDLFKIQQGLAIGQEAKHQALAKGDGHRRESDVVIPTRDLQPDAAVLGQALFSDIEVAHDLDARGDAGLKRARKRLHGLIEHVVDPEAYADLLLERFDVDIAGSLLHGMLEQRVHQANDGRIVRGFQ